MMNLVFIEWLKLKRLVTFKVILILYAVLLPLFFYSLSEISLFKYFYSDSIYTFPKVYHYVTYMSSFFNLMLGVIIVLFTCNEIKYKTQRQNMIDGLSKREMILSKFYVILLMSLFITLYAFLVAICFGMSTQGTEGAVCYAFFIRFTRTYPTGRKTCAGSHRFRIVCYE